MLEDREDADSKTAKRKNNLVSTMHAILKPFLLRRVKTDVEASLPKKREYILYAPLTAEQKDLYREILAGTSRSYLEDKAVERINSRASSLKRKANSSGRSTPAKSPEAHARVDASLCRLHRLYQTRPQSSTYQLRRRHRRRVQQETPPDRSR